MKWFCHFVNFEFTLGGCKFKIYQYDRLNEVLVYGIDYAILLSVPTFY